MSGQSIILLTDDQARAIAETAKAVAEAVKALQAAGGAVWQILGVPVEDLVGLLGGNWIKVRRAENLVRLFARASERLKRDGVKVEPASLSIGLPILEAAADESRDELQDLLASLLAAAADPARKNAFRNAFIDVIRKMDPLDFAVLRAVHARGGRITSEVKKSLEADVRARADEVAVSINNLKRLGLVADLNELTSLISAFGREFMRTLKP